MNTSHFIHSAVLVFSAVTLSAQVNHSGSVELLDASEDNTQVLFQVDGIAAKKGDVALSARETVFYKLFYEGVEGVNDDAPMVTKSKNYYVENFFAKRNPAMNRFVVLEELKGAVNRNVDGQYIGTYELTINLKALVNALNKAGATDAPVVRTAPPTNGPIGIGAGKKSQQASAPLPPAPKPAQDQPATKPAQNQPVSAPAPAAEPAPSKVIITKIGVGPVKVGQNYTISEDVLNKSKLPDKYAFLYDHLLCDRDQFSGDFVIIGYLNGKVSLYVLSDEDDKVSCFTVVTDNAKTTDGLSTASTAKEITAAGAKLDKMPYDHGAGDKGYLYRLVKDGVFFLFRNSDTPGGKIRPDAKPYAISNTLFGGVSEDELGIM
jgi:hypothetical protein